MTPRGKWHLHLHKRRQSTRSLSSVMNCCLLVMVTAIGHNFLDCAPLQFILPCLDDLSWESAAAVCGSDVSSLDISDSECSSMNGDSTNKVKRQSIYLCSTCFSGLISVFK